ncbi:MAG TPA: biopolymer transporter ExbD [Candidatus Sulfotelmatobacter sp.]|nr:biopolymer transporter ExbD [Candidatus Sulfotelmatobacter sp.]
MTRIPESLFAMLILAVSYLTAQTMPPPQPGISVEMAVTEHAQPMPEADDANAWVVTIDRFGTIYFRANQTNIVELANWIRSHPHSPDAKLYIKADTGVAFAIVREVLDAGREAGFDTPVMLTSQTTRPSTERLVLPMGVSVRMGQAMDKDSVVAEVTKTNQPSPALKINNQRIPASAFASTLSAVLQARTDKTVFLKADDRLLFSQVVQVIDVCRSIGANIAVSALK